MSEQPQHPSDPQAPEGDLLNETAEDQAADKAPRPPEPPAETPPSPPQPEKNRRSSVYVYLAVLFGAAFLMLLLAYFVQQRNNATAMDDLRMTTNASREELMAKIQTLEGEKEALEAQVAELELDLAQEQSLSQDFQTLYDGARTSASHLEYCLIQRSQAMELFWQLDKAYLQRDEASCQTLIKWLELPEADPRKNYLPTADDRGQYDYGLDGPTPAERYQEIYDDIGGQ